MLPKILFKKRGEMLNNLENLTPKEVFRWFYEICNIPHGSGNTQAIADFISNFAVQRGYRNIKDEANNVIVYADGTLGYENSKPIILQGHIDMVCEKDNQCTIDMETEPVKLCTNGEFIWADGTTLGGDNGIAIAYMLAILDDKSIPHPPLECLFTADEEIGMVGARFLDVNNLNTNLLINIDSEVEGVLTVSCAGGVRAHCDIPIEKENTNGECFKITINGLRGGHSGIDINQRRINANKLMAEVLCNIYPKIKFRLVEINGGNKDNVITSSCECIICVDNTITDNLLETVNKINNRLKAENKNNEPNLNISAVKVDNFQQCMTLSSTEKILFALLQVPNGVETMSPDIPNMVQTSLSLGVLNTKENSVYMRFFIRSNVDSEKEALVLKIQSFFEHWDGTTEFCNDYPAWEYRQDSRLREIMIETFKKIYGYAPKVTALHAGLECGILSGKIPNMDAVSFGPDMFNVHTSKEKLNVASAERCWEYLKSVLENCK